MVFMCIQKNVFNRNNETNSLSNCITISITISISRQSISPLFISLQSSLFAFKNNKSLFCVKNNDLFLIPDLSMKSTKMKPM